MEGFILVGFYSRGQISGRSGRREAKREVGVGVGGVGTDGLFTKGSGATGMLYISAVSCPGFPPLHTEQRGEGGRLREADKLCCVWWGERWDRVLRVATHFNLHLRHSADTLIQT